MANQEKSPFQVLGITFDAEAIVIQAAYRALARQYHPDMNPDTPAELVNQRMAELNWAREELARDLEGWRSREAIKAGQAQGTVENNSPTQGSASSVPIQRRRITVEPPVIDLVGQHGSSAVIVASAPDLDGAAIRARFKAGCLNVERLSSQPGQAIFRVSLKEDFSSDIEDALVEELEIVAEGFVGTKSFVSIAPLTQAILQQRYPGRLAPARHATPSAKISFGRHRGNTFTDIAVNEPGYLRWMLREGAGTRIERQCAQMALSGLHGDVYIGAPARSRASELSVGRQSKQAALPNPDHPRGLLGVLRGLLRSGREQ